MVALIGGCGFQLRTADISTLQGIHVSGAAAAPTIYRSMVATMEGYGVMNAPASNASLFVSLLDERTTRRSVATTSLIDAAEYELRVEVDIAINLGDESLATDTMVVHRVYAVDAVNLSGSTEEQRLLLEEMYGELSFDIVRRIENLKLSR